MNFNLSVILDLLGTFAFAVSGIKMASGKKIDWFGAYIIGLVTAIGGGTTRDLLLGVSPFWMHDPKYLITTAVALVAAIIFKDKLFKWGSTLFLFDSIGLGVFTIAGISASLNSGLSIWACILMGMITGSIGGVIRDVIINDVPLIFRKDIYASACIAGGVVFFAVRTLTSVNPIAELSGVITVIIIRIIAVMYHLQLPILLLGEKKSEL